MIKIYFEFDDKYNQYNQYRDMIINRDDISKFDYFDEEESYYFDFMTFIIDIIDIIFDIYYLYINDNKGQIFIDEDGRFIESYIGGYSIYRIIQRR